jgi:hypothetical protein
VATPIFIPVLLYVYLCLQLGQPAAQPDKSLNTTLRCVAPLLLFFLSLYRIFTIYVRPQASHAISVLTTCSPHKFELLRSRGADHVLPYRDPFSSSEIKKIISNDLAYAFDCIGEGSA